jgi:type 1 fimbria pilin
MTSSVRNSVRVLTLLLVTLCAYPTTASVGSGRVSFYGSIVEPSCLIVHHARKPALDCSVRSDYQVGFEKNFVKTQLDYIDQEKKLAVLMVTYR